MTSSWLSICLVTLYLRLFSLNTKVLFLIVISNCNNGNGVFGTFALDLIAIFFVSIEYTLLFCFNIANLLLLTSLLKIPNSDNVFELSMSNVVLFVIVNLTDVKRVRTALSKVSFIVLILFFSSTCVLTTLPIAVLMSAAFLTFMSLLFLYSIIFGSAIGGLLILFCCTAFSP